MKNDSISEKGLTTALKAMESLADQHPYYHDARKWLARTTNPDPSGEKEKHFFIDYFFDIPVTESGQVTASVIVAFTRKSKNSVLPDSVSVPNLSDPDALNYSFVVNNKGKLDLLY